MLAVKNILTGEVGEIESAYVVVERNLPLVISTPHSGRCVLEKYADHFTFGDGFRVDNDMYTGELYPLELGSSISGNLSQHQVNMNRSWELIEGRDPLMTISFLSEDDIYTKPWSDVEREELRLMHKAYHSDLARLMKQMKETYGYALLIDCHSLNSRALSNTPDAGSIDRADFVIGSLDGASADSRVVDVFHEALEKQATPRGLKVVRNNPYKGGWITKTWARPEEGFHVLQLEIKKKMYMYEGIDDDGEKAFQKRDSFADIQKVLEKAFRETRDFASTIL
ncbi:N-formylglutamate amidohydrolase [Candidatus Nomurabacteria bacterium]|nr:N-formylglutamate amidohydrolase [Candidatus Kaiserbacteria bacterium]MCB9814587.1 N-formylglutamate amidohydrolase [Candidatus Nomurabacteria bacterium]